MSRPTFTVFVYGTLKQGGSLHRYLEHSHYLGEATLRDHEMYDLGWFPGIVPGNGEVHGELYDVDNVTLASLDACEGEGHLYHRKRMWVQLNDEVRVLAFVYVYAHGVDDKEKVATGCWELAR